MLNVGDKIFELIDCPLCNSSIHETVYSRKQYLESEIDAVTIDLVICKYCGFMFQNPQFKDDFLIRHYLEDSSGNVYKEKTKDHRRYAVLQERKSFIERYLNKNDGFLIDVGGGQGDLIECLNLAKWKKHLLEPSKAINRQKISDDIVVYNVPIEMYECEEQYDALICISTLEHLKNPNRVISKFSKMLKKGGNLFVEVPDSLRPVAQIAEFFSYEYLSHFTRATLTLLLEKHGFTNIEFDDGGSLPNIRVSAKKINDPLTTESGALPLKQCIIEYTEQRSRFIEKIKNRLSPVISRHKTNNKQIAVYGAGEHTKFLIETFGIEELIQCFFDSDPQKRGKFFYNKEIFGPDSINALNIETIIISSHEYESEIYNTIIKHAKSPINIITFYSDDE